MKHRMRKIFGRGRRLPPAPETPIDRDDAIALVAKAFELATATVVDTRRTGDEALMTRSDLLVARMYSMAARLGRLLDADAEDAALVRPMRQLRRFVDTAERLGAASTIHEFNNA